MPLLQSLFSLQKEVLVSTSISIFSLGEKGVTWGEGNERNQNKSGKGRRQRLFWSHCRCLRGTVPRLSVNSGDILMSAQSMPDQKRKLTKPTRGQGTKWTQKGFSGFIGPGLKNSMWRKKLGKVENVVFGMTFFSAYKGNQKIVMREKWQIKSDNSHMSHMSRSQKDVDLPEF